MVPLKRQKTCTRLHSVIYQKKAIIITQNGWQTRVLARNVTAGNFKLSVGTASFTRQDHLQARQLLHSSSESFHCVLLNSFVVENIRSFATTEEDPKKHTG
jgi:hypothetical protein